MMHTTLNDGSSMPMVGLGTWKAKGDEVYRAVRHALDVGYTHIDTAAVYGNEQEVGRAIADSHVDRDSLYITSKVWNTVHTYEAAAEAVTESLTRLNIDYLNLMLIHWPWTYERNRAVYRALEDAVKAGTVRSIGVSNFNIHHLDALLQDAEIAPAVNQMECHVALQNTRLKDYLDSRGMVLEAYAPLKSWKVGDVLENETLRAIAKAHGTTPTQVVIRWLVQRGVVALPKSVTPERITANLDVFGFELSEPEMQKIRALNRGERLFPEPDNVDFGFVEV